MSRYESGHSRDTKGHGALGFFITFILVAFAIIAVILFYSSGDSMEGLKGKVYSAFYPQKYSEQVQKYAAEFGVEEPLVYAVIRTESGFRPEVESHAGAVGLMQLMPSTFEWLQEGLDGGITYNAASLTDPDINIRYGTYLLSVLLMQYDDNMSTAVAAYNAGIATVGGWLEDSSYSSDGKTLTRIPYEETERYVERVQSAYSLYKKLYY